ncbi:hypothetical protein BDY21DRAFT_68455 [Lineolata rhizophorae]|uniref:Uncharacterized protein n=1 Tax=Lineolata rhizophorae TaxID=578093 RepID=A0A6A6NV04_9PEZI|nr:hypothetical protein BDY21DRAFT_68455 [Lineolata rhizophorae]
MIVLGIFDDALEMDFTSVEQIFQLRVDPRQQSMRLKWKKTWEERLIFWQAVPILDGIRTSHEEPLHYHSFLCHIQRLGFIAGMMKILNP